LKRNVTQQSLAEAAGMSLTYISNMEHGLKVPSHYDHPDSRRPRLQGDGFGRSVRQDRSPGVAAKVTKRP